MTSSPISQRPFLDLYGPQFQSDPHAVLRTLREQSWCADTAIGLAVLGYDEVQALLTHRKFRTPGADWLALQGITQGPIVDMMSAFLLNTHGPAHDRVRRLVQKAFTLRTADGFRFRIRAHAAKLIENLVGECDFMESFAIPYAWRVLCEFVGIPASALSQVQKWNADVALMFGLSVNTHAARITAALSGLRNFIDELVARERTNPSGSLLSALVAAGESEETLTASELQAMVITLMAAGSGTVTHQLGNTIVTLLAHPDKWQQLAQKEVAIVPLVEELIRINPAVILGVPRLTMEDLEWNGISLPKGSCVLPMTGSANRDERVFADGERFEPMRQERPHLTFGGGIHYCLGAALGRAELQEALPLLAKRLPILHQAGPVEWIPATEAVYGPVRLPLRCAPSKSPTEQSRELHLTSE